jgi:hypothetical protein
LGESFLFCSSFFFFYSLLGFFLFFIGATASIGPCPLQQFVSRYPCPLLVSPSSYIEQQLGLLPDFVFSFMVFPQVFFHGISYPILFFSVF